MLPAAPQHLVDADGQPLLGRYRGLAHSFDWAALAAPHGRSALWRRFHHKRWHYVALASDSVFCAVAIVDVGWTSTAFAYVFERGSQRVIAAYSQDALPGLGARVGAHARAASHYRMPGRRIALLPQAEHDYLLELETPGLAISARFGGPAPQLLAVGPVAGGSIHATQKSGGMPLSGQVCAGGQLFSLDGGVASCDYSNGLLARDTDWRWASAHGLEIGFNLQAGYFGANENALWLDGQLIALGPAEFVYDAGDPMAPWQVRSACGLLDLVFTPHGLRREDKDLLVAASRYVQPIGVFDGVVRAAPDAPARQVRALAGVTEDHRSRW
ncbi:DUF2804 domain-containing protein [Massilia sp. TS11]|uniref:DUF2804 domain-containing protein n=1 Tax=Massilia sp. TS11 TaxID=2908003 RepID=UPI001ED9FAA3|nr:DUF2804 domain-containing protein [Massilia sp. TS11]MCG2583357.1 DUF2804 domain-containing protein [Massilia sp. TS11]